MTPKSAQTQPKISPKLAQNEPNLNMKLKLFKFYDFPCLSIFGFLSLDTKPIHRTSSTTFGGEA
jgi:hypothetical protein